MTEDFFSKTGLTVGKQDLKDIEVGKTYPLYGMITKVISDTTESVVVEINYVMKITMVIKEVNQIAVLKERAFDPGIFVIEVSNKDLSSEEGTYAIEGQCTTVVFGKRKENYDA